MSNSSYLTKNEVDTVREGTLRKLPSSSSNQKLHFASTSVGMTDTNVLHVHEGHIAKITRPEMRPLTASTTSPRSLAFTPAEANISERK